jgi:hypothetical protein
MTIDTELAAAWIGLQNLGGVRSMGAMTGTAGALYHRHMRVGFCELNFGIKMTAVTNGIHPVF